MLSSRWSGLLAVAVVGGTLLLPAVAQGRATPSAAGRADRQTEPPCVGAYENVVAQGRSCRVEGGLWKVQLRDGTHLLTHGPDAAPPFGADEIPPSRPIVCSDLNPHGDFRQVAILAWPSDVTPNKTKAQVRQDVQWMNGRLNQEAIASGGTGADYVFACDKFGQIRVDAVELPTPNSQASFSTIVSDLRAKGYWDWHEKYVIHYDAGLGYCGQGDIRGSEVDGASNPNNVGPNYGINYDCLGWFVFMHENGHNLGAVQYNAPFSTGTGWHCWQGDDVMCYSDGGDKDPGYIQRDCLDYTHWDCKNNDFFDAKIGAGEGGGVGSYIDTSWNIGECYVRWIVNKACLGPESTVYPSAVDVLRGTLESGGPADLQADDDQFLEIASPARPKFSTSWTATFTGVPNELTSVKLTLKGKASRNCTQSFWIRNWTADFWAKVDGRRLGSDEVELTKMVGGTLADYVSGTSGPGELRTRVMCKTGAQFTTSTDLARLVYTAP
jgi:hypothetical protein